MAVRKRKLKSGNKWFVDVRLPNGRRIRKTVGTKKQAEEIERRIISEIVEEKWNIHEKQDIRFDELAKEYLLYAEANKASNTFRTDKCRIELHLMKYFKKIPISYITPKMVDQYKQMRVKEGASAIAVNHDLTNLSHMLKMAIRWGYIDRNVVSSIDKMKVQKRSSRFLSQDESKNLVEAARDTHIYPLIMTALHTGMRKSELFNLKWSDISFESRMINVQSKSDWHTKNYKPRAVPMTPALYDALWEHREESRASHCPYVFTYNGRQLKSNIKRSLRRVMQMAGLETEGDEKVTLHSLRHTFASHLVMAGVPLMDVQELLGHQNFETTLQYAHLAPDHSIQQVNRLPFANGFDSSKAQIGHTKGGKIVTLKKEESCEVASSQGS